MFNLRKGDISLYVIIKKKRTGRAGGSFKLFSSQFEGGGMDPTTFGDLIVTVEGYIWGKQCHKHVDILDSFCFETSRILEQELQKF